MNRKVTVVGGAGNVGATVARGVADKQLADVVVIDIADKKAAGVALGVLVALNVGTIAPFLEHVLGFRFFDADVFYITALPSELQSADVLWTSVAALLLTLAATVCPSLRAAATPPAVALRYE